MPLYHHRTGFPPGLNRPQGRIMLQYGHHAEKAMVTDSCRRLADLAPAFLHMDEAQLIEAEITDDGVPTKFLFRLRLTSVHDLCLVVCPDGFVKTLWTDRRSDSHATLDTSRYCRACPSP